MYQKGSIGDNSQGIEVDEDGDLVVRRRHPHEHQILVIGRYAPLVHLEYIYHHEKTLVVPIESFHVTSHPA